MDEKIKKQLLALKIAVGVLSVALVSVGIILTVVLINAGEKNAGEAQAAQGQITPGPTDIAQGDNSPAPDGTISGKNTPNPAEVGGDGNTTDPDTAGSSDSGTAGGSDSGTAGGSDSNNNITAPPTPSESPKPSEAKDPAGVNPQPTSGPQSTTPPSESSDKSQGDYALAYSIGNSWEDAGVKMCTVEFSLTNNTSSAAKDWTLVLELDRPLSVNGWNGTYSLNGTTITIQGADHNREISPNGTVYLGCNVGMQGSFQITGAWLDGSPCSFQSGSVDQNAQNSGSGNQANNNQQNTETGKDKNDSSVDMEAILNRADAAVQGDDWLHTDGRRILDKDGKEVWLTGVNWFGYNTGTNTFDGLWTSKLEPTVKAVADHGFNLIRVPFSAQLINQWAAGEYPKANYNQAYNPALNNMNSLEIFDYFLTLAEANGIKVMIDIHCAETNASGHMVNLWYSGSVSTEDYYAALEWMAARYKNNDTIIAYDLKNEPHGKPDEGNGAAIWNNSKQSNNWKYVAETAAAKVLAKNPNVLILVEGTEIYPKNNRGDYSSSNSADYYFNWWGGNLRAVKDFPIDLGKYQDKLVYSPHDYGPTVYKQPWFSGNYTYDSLMKDCWHDNWFYIYEDNIAPLLIGEWGGFMSEPNLTWMTYMRQLISTYHVNHTFWCLNANSGDTGGLLLDDFTTWDSQKYNFVKEVLWQENGKFVGLDHAIPLGENGITLKEAKGL